MVFGRRLEDDARLDAKGERDFSEPNNFGRGAHSYKHKSNLKSFFLHKLGYGLQDDLEAFRLREPAGEKEDGLVRDAPRLARVISVCSIIT